MNRPLFNSLPWVVAMLCVVGLLAACDKAPSKPKKQQMVKILPDTPPPPPPKQEDKKPEPQKEDRPQQQLNQPKPTEAPPQPQALKSNEAAGDGPGNGLQAGSVTQDYKGGPVLQASTSASAGVVDRARERLYANSARQLLRDEIEKRLRPEAGQLTAAFAIWVGTDGRIQRFEILPSGQTGAEADMRSALDEASRHLRLPPPDGVTQPMRFRLTVQPQG